MIENHKLTQKEKKKVANTFSFLLCTGWSLFCRHPSENSPWQLHKNSPETKKEQCRIPRKPGHHKKRENFVSFANKERARTWRRNRIIAFFEQCLVRRSSKRVDEMSGTEFSSLPESLSVFFFTQKNALCERGKNYNEMRGGLVGFQFKKREFILSFWRSKMVDTEIKSPSSSVKGCSFSDDLDFFGVVLRLVVVPPSLVLTSFFFSLMIGTWPFKNDSSFCLWVETACWNDWSKSLCWSSGIFPAGPRFLCRAWAISGAYSETTLSNSAVSASIARFLPPYFSLSQKTEKENFLEWSGGGHALCPRDCVANQRCSQRVGRKRGNFCCTGPANKKDTSNKKGLDCLGRKKKGKTDQPQFFRRFVFIIFQNFWKFCQNVKINSRGNFSQIWSQISQNFLANKFGPPLIKHGFIWKFLSCLKKMVCWLGNKKTLTFFTKSIAPKEISRNFSNSGVGWIPTAYLGCSIAFRIKIFLKSSRLLSKIGFSAIALSWT